MTSKDVSFLTYFKNKEERDEIIEKIQQLVDLQREGITCFECRKTMVNAYFPYIYYYEVGGENRELTIENAPVYECECGNKEINILLYAEVETAVENEIFNRLNKRKEIPTTIDFSEFTTKNNIA